MSKFKAGDKVILCRRNKDMISGWVAQPMDSIYTLGIVGVVAKPDAFDLEMQTYTVDFDGYTTWHYDEDCLQLASDRKAYEFDAVVSKSPQPKFKLGDKVSSNDNTVYTIDQIRIGKSGISYLFEGHSSLRIGEENLKLYSSIIEYWYDTKSGKPKIYNNTPEEMNFKRTPGKWLKVERHNGLIVKVEILK